MNNMMKVVQALKYCNILLKEINKTIKNEIKKQKERFLRMLLGTLLTKKIILEAAYVIKEEILIPLHSLTNIEIQKYYQNERRFNGVYCGFT